MNTGIYELQRRDENRMEAMHFLGRAMVLFLIDAAFSDCGGEQERTEDAKPKLFHWNKKNERKHEDGRHEGGEEEEECMEEEKQRDEGGFSPCCSTGSASTRVPTFSSDISLLSFSSETEASDAGSLSPESPLGKPASPSLLPSLEKEGPLNVVGIAPGRRNIISPAGPSSVSS